MEKYMDTLMESLKHITCDDMRRLYHATLTGAIDVNAHVMLHMLGEIVDGSAFSEVEDVQLQKKEAEDMVSRGFGVVEHQEKKEHFCVYADLDPNDSKPESVTAE
jgi:hypothetical protein